MSTFPKDVQPGSNGSSAGEPLDEMNQHGLRIQEIIEQIDSLPNPAARALMQECLESVLSFYGQGLERILQIIKRSGIGAQRAYDDLLDDNLVRGLLLIHGLHPSGLETRLREALDKIRPYLKSHGGDVDLLGIENGFARLRLRGSCQTCPSSSVTLELAVRHAIEEACPDLQDFHVEGAPKTSPSSEVRRPEWRDIGLPPDLVESRFTTMEIAGVPLLICCVNEDLYAYRDRCPICNTPLHLGSLEDGVLTCGSGHRFGVQDAGRAIGNGAAHLDPFPLVVDPQSVKVALPPSRTAQEAVEQ
jgi:Fe-S cluster biogenesis protein NfuA/nitrite reductase/ring-hydroxylating ferredoxin subunit